MVIDASRQNTHETVLSGFVAFSWILLIPTRPFLIAVYFDLKAIFHGFALQSFTVCRFELKVFCTGFAPTKG